MLDSVYKRIGKNMNDAQKENGDEIDVGENLVFLAAESYAVVWGESCGATVEPSYALYTP